MDIEKKVYDIIKEPIESVGLTLYEVKYLKEDNINFLRVIIDNDSYIKIEDCVKVNNVINPILDEIDFISETYILDVCSKTKEEE